MKYALYGMIIAALACAPAMSFGAPPTQAKFDSIGFDQHIGSVVPLDARFNDAKGSSVALSRYLEDKPAILLLGYHECPNLCSTTRQALARSLHSVSLKAGVDYEVLAVSIDPQESLASANKASASVASISDALNASPHGWHFLTGRQDAIAALTQSVGFRYAYDPAQHQYMHPAGVVIVTPNGKVARYFFGVDYAPNELRQSLVDAGAERVEHPVPALLLRCLHYDPITGRYSVAVDVALRIVGVAVLILLGALVLILERRHRRARRVSR